MYGVALSKPKSFTNLAANLDPTQYFFIKYIDGTDYLSYKTRTELWTAQ
jgi:hypothetical protein